MTLAPGVWRAASGCLLVACLAVMPHEAHAQITGNPDDARLHVGPLGITPRFAVRDLGVDTNVFNSESDPRRDLVGVLSPSAAYWLRIARIVVSGRTTFDWNYFQRERTQRSANFSQAARLDVDLSVVTPYLEGTYLRTRQRPNPEVDLRIPQQRPAASAGVAVHLGPRTTIDLGFKLDQFRFDEFEQDGRRIATALNRNTKNLNLSLKRALTALTTWSVRGDLVQERFRQEPRRNTDSMVVATELDFKPSAFVSGTARVGVRRLRAARDVAPDFRGVVAAVNLNYILLEQTQFVVKFDRDVEYSSEDFWPYYVLSGGTLEVRRAVGFVWDVVARGGRSVLNYRAFAVPAGDTGVADRRRDEVTLLGVGLGRHLSDEVRVGVDVSHEERRSPVIERSYRRYRVGGSMTYGF